MKSENAAEISKYAEKWEKLKNIYYRKQIITEKTFSTGNQSLQITFPMVNHTNEENLTVEIGKTESRERNSLKMKKSRDNDSKLTAHRKNSKADKKLIDHTFACYYNRENLEDVILTKVII